MVFLSGWSVFIDESEMLNSLFLLCCFCFLSLWLFVFALYIELLLYWVHACLCAKSLQCCLTDPMDCSLHGIFRQEYWSGLPCPPPGNLLHPGIKPASPAFQADFFTAEPPIEANIECIYIFNCYIFFLDWALNHSVLSFIVYCKVFIWKSVLISIFMGCLFFISLCSVFMCLDLKRVFFWQYIYAS